MSEDRRRPFLKQAQGKSAEDRTFFEKIAVGIYGEGKELLPDLQLDDNFEDLIKQLPDTYGNDVDIMVEAKHKELAIQGFMKWMVG